jgi:hypothetical protein
MLEQLNAGLCVWMPWDTSGTQHTKEQLTPPTNSLSTVVVSTLSRPRHRLCRSG